MSPCTTWPTFCSSDMRAINSVILPSMTGSSRTGDLIAGQVAGFATLDAAGASARVDEACCPDAGTPMAKAAMARPAKGAPLPIISHPLSLCRRRSPKLIDIDVGLGDQRQAFRKNRTRGEG